MHDDHDQPRIGDSHGESAPSLFWHFLLAISIIAALAVGVSLVEWLQPFSIPTAAVVLVALPLVAFTTQMLVGRFLPRKGDWVSLSAIFLSCVLGVWIFFSILRGTAPVHSQFEWIKVGLVSIKIGVNIDGLTAVMLFIVTFIGGVIHLYSMGYMSGDPRYGRFFGFLSIFCFSMLGLVVTDNLLILYVFWELVGLSSYLLIGFWYEKKSAADASMKAFLTNRVGDIGFFMGMAALYQWTGTFVFSEIFEKLPHLLESGAISPLKLTVAGLAVFCGAIGKSAQFPLHVWLPDAMEGPTPVSALIHAATMVAAGVYMVGRLYPIFTPEAFMGIALIGLITAFFAGTIAIAQNDIKRVLAYSTVSQLGYMITALGIGGYTAGLFHLSTHAFFKALLFLCSGSVIHAVHSQDMREMGGLWRKLPITFTAMLIGTLAICGVPGTSGFYSKDAILEAAYEFGHRPPLYSGIAGTLCSIFQHGVFWLALIAAGVTAFYSFRLIWMTFFGTPKFPAKYARAHESPAVMTAPLILLSVFALFTGLGFLGQESSVKQCWAQANSREKVASEVSSWRLGLQWGMWYPGLVERPRLPLVEHYKDKLGMRWAGLEEDSGPVGATELRRTEGEAAGVGSGHAGKPESMPDHTPGILAITVVLIGFLLSIPCFLTRTITLESIETIMPALGRPLRFLHSLLENKYYVDEFYRLVFIDTLLLVNECVKWFDQNIIDRIVNGCAHAFRDLTAFVGKLDLFGVDGLVNWIANMALAVGDRMRTFQTGLVQGYLVHSFWVVVLALVLLQFLAGGNL